MSAPLSLKRRSVKAGVWTGGGHALSQVLRLAGNLVLTRLLMPEAFGLMAVVMTLLMALELLSDIGSGTIIVQSERGAEEDFLNTAWTLQIIRGILLWLVGLGIAAGIKAGQAYHWFNQGTVYDDPMLPVLVAAATFSMVIYGLVSLNAKLAQRNLDLKTLSIVELMVQVISLCSIVAIGYLTRSIWALVAGGLITAALQCVLTHTVLKGPRPRLRLEPSAVRELLSKGKWILASSLLGFIALSGDRMLLGGLVDSATLGLYSIAFGLASIAPAAFSAILGRVVFPALSEVVRDRPAELRGTYRRFQQITDAFVGFLAGLLFISSGPIIAFLYDPRYHEAGAILAFLAIGSVGMRVVVIEQIYVATGQTSLLALAAVPRAATLLVGVPIGYAVAQLNGALAAIVLSQFAHWPLAIWYRWRKALNDIRNDIVLPVAIAFGCAVGWLGLRLLSLLQNL